MLREPPAGCQEPGLAEAPWGRRVPPQEEAPGEGDGSGGEPALRAKARVLGRGLGARGSIKKSDLVWSCHPKQEKKWKGLGETGRHPATWPNLAPCLEFSQQLPGDLFNFCPPHPLNQQGAPWTARHSMAAPSGPLCSAGLQGLPPRGQGASYWAGLSPGQERGRGPDSSCQFSEHRKHFPGSMSRALLGASYTSPNLSCMMTSGVRYR